MNIPDDWIAYFITLVESDSNAEHWGAWWERNHAEAESVFARGRFLRISTTPCKEIYSILAELGHHYDVPKTYRHPKFHVPSPVPEDWLIEEIPAVVVDEELSGSILYKSDWLPIKEDLTDSDSCWRFSSSERSWKAMMGRRGYAFVRDGKVFDAIITAMN
ncbi:MAG: hypothetical protein V4675_25125 [Verrucomicrobiota bacterium]